MRAAFYHPAWRPGAAYAALLLCLAWSFAPREVEGGESGLDPEVEYTLTVHRVWGTAREGDSDLPERLRGLEAELRRCTKKKAFRSSEEPVTGRIRGGGKPFEADLPDGYKARWSIEKDDEGQWTLRQVLVNPRGAESSVRPSKSPVIVELGKVQRDGATLILVVELTRTPA